MWTTMRTFGRTYWLIYLALYLTLFAVSLVAIPNTTQRPLTILLLIAYALLTAASTLLFKSRPIFSHLYFAAHLGILLGLMFANPHLVFVLSILSLPIVSQAPLLLPLGAGFGWTAVIFIVAMAVIGQFDSSARLGDAGLSLTGYIGFAAFGATVRQSEANRRRAQTLLADLQATHEQLKQYTAQAEYLAVSQERHRLARELHDALGHRLTVAVVQLEGARRLIPTSPDRAAEIVDTMRTQLKEALAELRQAVSTLRKEETAVTNLADLPTAVAQLVHTFQTATGLTVHLSQPEALPPLPSSHRHALYRAVQESLTNVQRHANATTAWVDMQLDNHVLTLTTADNGQGFSDTVADGRFGLRGLAERASHLGGDLQIGRSQHGGAQLQFTLPLPNGASHA